MGSRAGDFSTSGAPPRRAPPTREVIPLRPSTRIGLALVAISIPTSAAVTAYAEYNPEVMLRAGAAHAQPKVATQLRRAHAAATARFPVAGGVDFGTTTNRFGDDRGDHIHAGQDLFAPAGRSLVAIRDGVVLETGSDGGRGNYVYLYSPDVDETYAYFHMQSPSRVGPGDRIKAGDRLGEVGCTGSCWGDHLHFELREGRGPDGHARDPWPLLRRLERANRPSPGGRA